MAQTTIRADGKSSLSHYVDLLFSVPAKLKVLLDRDAEAVRILTATPSLSEAIWRAERWYWDRQREKQTGGIVLTRRIWTRRDERRVNMLRGLPGRLWPSCRAARYLDRLQPRSRLSTHHHWFRLAVDEARRDGTAAVLSPKLEQTQAIYERLITAAGSVTQDDGGRSDFDSARRELSSRVCELMNWTKPTKSQLVAGPDVNATVVAGNAAHREDEAKPTKSTGPTSKSEQPKQWTAEAMLLIRDHPEWSDAEIARRVGKDKSTLSRSKDYQAAAAMARGAKDDRHSGHITVDPDSGLRDVEAYSDDPAERDWDD